VVQVDKEMVPRQLGTVRQQILGVVVAAGLEEQHPPQRRAALVAMEDLDLNGHQDQVSIGVAVPLDGQAALPV
jgi:hypothetical protein